MQNKVFVGNLNWETTDDSLREAFEPVGSVTEATVVLDRYTGRSRGFGFVSFAEPSAMRRAVDEMNGAPIDGRRVNVDVANQRSAERRPGW